MKKSIPTRILSVFLALLMFFTTFPVGAIQAFANVASGQITIPMVRNTKLPGTTTMVRMRMVKFAFRNTVEKLPGIKPVPVQPIF